MKLESSTEKGHNSISHGLSLFLSNFLKKK